MCTRRVARDANYASARICPVPAVVLRGKLHPRRRVRSAPVHFGANTAGADRMPSRGPSTVSARALVQVVDE